MAKKKKAEVPTCESIDDALTFIQKRFGKESARVLSDSTSSKGIDVVSTGSLWLDAATGIGGFPRGRVVDLTGPEGSGKTTLALHAIAEVNKKDEDALFIDMEHALDPMLATNVGVNPDKFVLSQPDCAEDALDLIIEGMKLGKFGVIVLDSVAALVPRAEIEGDMNDSQMGLQARLMGKALRKITGSFSSSKSNPLIIFINQIRQKIGVMFGSNETSPGGNALKFFASMRLDIRAREKIKIGENIIGNKVSVKIIKNKLAVPFKIIETDLIYGHGFNKEKELIDLAHEYEIIAMKGPKYYYEKKCFATGKEEAYKALRDDPVLFEEILHAVKREGSVEKHKTYLGNEDED